MNEQLDWLKESVVFPFNVDVDVTFVYGPSNFEPKDGPFQRQYTVTVEANGVRMVWSMNYVLHDRLSAELGMAQGTVIRMKRTKPAQGKAFWTCLNSEGLSIDVVPEVFQQNQPVAPVAPQPVQTTPPVSAAPPRPPAPASIPEGPPPAPRNQPPVPPPANRSNKPSAEDYGALMQFALEASHHAWMSIGVDFGGDNIQATANTLFIQLSNKGVAVPQQSAPIPPPANEVPLMSGGSVDEDGYFPVSNPDDLPF